MEHANDVKKLVRRIWKLRTRDLSPMGFEARAGHQRRLEELEQLYRNMTGREPTADTIGVGTVGVSTESTAVGSAGAADL